MGRMLGLILVLLAPSRGWATSNNVVLVELGTTFADEAWTAAEQRTSAELTSMGFSVIHVAGRASDEAERREELERITEHHDAVAALTIRRVVHDYSVELWVADRVTGKVCVRRVKAAQLRDSDAAALVGHHIVELLHASLLELQIVRDEQARATAPSVAREIAQAAPAPAAVAVADGLPWTLLVGAGVAGSLSPGKLSGTLGPLMRLGVRVDERYTLSGEATTSLLTRRVAREGASATVDLALARARVSVAPWVLHNFSIAVGLDAGALWARTVGVTETPWLLGKETSSLVFLPGAALSGTWTLSSAFALMATANAAIPVQRVRLRFGNEQVARLGSWIGEGSLALMIEL